MNIKKDCQKTLYFFLNKMKNSLCILLCIFTHFKNTYLQHYTLNIAFLSICMLYMSYSYRFGCSLNKRTTKLQFTIKKLFSVQIMVHT